MSIEIGTASMPIRYKTSINGVPVLPPAREIALTTKVPTVAELLGDRYTDAYRAAFPDVAIPYYPLGYCACLQLRMPLKKIGSILLADESVDVERFRTQAALVRAVGPSGFRDRQTGEPWVEGEWYKPGDFVRAPMYGGDRFDVEVTTASGTKDVVRFAFVKEADVTGFVIGDPLNIKNS